MDKETEDQLAHALFGLGSFMGTLSKLRQTEPERASDCYQQILMFMPPSELSAFLSQHWNDDGPKDNSRDNH